MRAGSPLLFDRVKKMCRARARREAIRKPSDRGGATRSGLIGGCSIERGYGKTFYFHDPNGIRLQIELKTKQDADSLEGDPDPVPYVRALLQRA